MTKRSKESKATKALRKLVYEQFPYMIVHMLGCQGVCFYIKKIPTLGEPIDPLDIINPDGTVPAMNESAKCFSCKGPLGHDDLQPDCARRVQ